MNWTVILSIATAVIQALSENCPAQDRKGILRAPAARHKRRFEARLQRELTNPWTGCMTRKEYRDNEAEILEQCYGQAAAMEDYELDQLLDG